MPFFACFESGFSLPVDGHETLADVARTVCLGPDENDVLLNLFFSSANVLYELVRLESQGVLDSMTALIPRSCTNLYCIHNKAYDHIVLIAFVVVVVVVVVVVFIAAAAAMSGRGRHRPRPIPGGGGGVYARAPLEKAGMGPFVGQCQAGGGKDGSYWREKMDPRVDPAGPEPAGTTVEQRSTRRYRNNTPS